MAIPVSSEDARRQLRLEDSDTSMDDDIDGFITDAAAWVEKYTGHIFEAGDVTEQLFAGQPPLLTAWPIKPTAVPSVAYVTSTGDTVTVAARLSSYSRPARVLPAPGQLWPWRWSSQAFTVTVRAGYEDDDVVPGNFRRAMLVLIAAYDEDREGGAIFQKAEETARLLCKDYRCRTL